MSRFALTLAVFVALFSSVVRAETIVWDNLEEVDLHLPTAGGSTTNQFNYPNGHGVTPYCISVSVADGDAAVANDYAGETEFFYFSDAVNGKYGDGSLLNSSYSANYQSTTQPNDEVAGSGRQYMGTEQNQIGNKGIYTFCFTIPPQSSLIFNITYIQNATNAAVSAVTELIEVVIMNGDATPVIVGDPQFVGLRGQSYQVHGMDGAVYNILSEKNTQVNSRFVFLTEGACPANDATNCWSHPGSYLGEISFQAVVAGKLHAALVQAGPAKKGFAGVQVDGKSVAVGDKVTFGAFSLEMTSAYTVTVQTENFAFELSNSDMFINQAVRAMVPLSELTSHGLLGQTHNAKTYATALKYIAGEVDDYVIADSDIFGTDFVYNQFQL